jgi:hypothetical protein
MNAFNLTIVILAIGVVVVACLSGICSLLLGERDNEHSNSYPRRLFARLWPASRRRPM